MEIVNKGNGNVRSKINKFEVDETKPIELKNVKLNNGTAAASIPCPSPRTNISRPSAPPAPPPVYSRVFSQTERGALLKKNSEKRTLSTDTDVDTTDHEYDTIDEQPRRVDVRSPRARQDEPEEPRRTSHTHLNITDNRNKLNYTKVKSKPIISASMCNFTRIAVILGIVCIVQLIILIILAIYLLSPKDLNYTGINSITQNNFGHVKPGELIFYDDFDNLNLTTWRHDRYISDDGFVIYGTDQKNSYVEDGILYIEPTFTNAHFNDSFMSYGHFQIGKTNGESCSSFIPAQCQKTARVDRPNAVILNPIMSATLKTSQSFTFQYGEIEIRAKMPKGDWISTEISLRPRYKYFGEPTDSAQIVLITTRGNSDYYAPNNTHFGNERFCSQLVYSDAHSTVIHSMVQFCQNSEPGEGFAEDFHTYKFDWTPELMKIFVDDKMTGKFIANSFVPNHVKHIVVPSDGKDEQLKSSFDQQFYIQLKVAVGVGFPDTGLQSAYRKPWTNNMINAPYTFWFSRRQWESTWQSNSTALQIDYIKVKAL